MCFPLVSHSVDPVCFKISHLHQIISSNKFHQLDYYIPHFTRELCKHHVRAPGQEKISPELDKFDFIYISLPMLFSI